MHVHAFTDAVTLTIIIHIKMRCGAEYAFMLIGHKSQQNIPKRLRMAHLQEINRGTHAGFHNQHAPDSGYRILQNLKMSQCCLEFQQHPRDKAVPSMMLY